MEFSICKLQEFSMIYPVCFSHQLLCCQCPATAAAVAVSVVLLDDDGCCAGVADAVAAQTRTACPAASRPDTLGHYHHRRRRTVPRQCPAVGCPRGKSEVPVIEKQSVRSSKLSNGRSRKSIGSILQGRRCFLV